MLKFVSIALLIVSLPSPARATVRLKDLAGVEGVRENQLVGYGVVVGLAGTGDRRQTLFSAQSLTNILQRMGVTVNPNAIRVSNTASVLLTAILPPFARPGMRVDVMVSAIGDSTNLQGGTLIISSLQGVDGQAYASAQGPVVTGGFAVSSAGTSRTLNHPTAGRIPSGAIVERQAPSVVPDDSIRWILNRADFTTAVRIADVINEKFAQGPIAAAESSGSVTVQVPSAYKGRTSVLIADLERLSVEVDAKARVVVNERSGTIVIGGEVGISPVSILHGALSVEIQTTFAVSQPAPFSQGQTQVVPQVAVNVNEEKAKSVQLPRGATVEELVKALTSVGATARDIIAILQNLRAAGALDAELEVI